MHATVEAGANKAIEFPHIMGWGRLPRRLSRSRGGRVATFRRSGWLSCQQYWFRGKSSAIGCTVSNVYLLCGKTGSGKSTFARRLETERRAFRLSVDELMLALFGPHMPRDVFEARLQACKAVWLTLAERLLAFGIDVVLDWGFWRKAERQAVRERFLAAGSRCELIYFDVSDVTLRERLRLRNSALPEGTYEITQEMFEMFSGWFEPPGPDEEFQRVTGDDGVDRQTR